MKSLKKRLVLLLWSGLALVFMTSTPLQANNAGFTVYSTYRPVDLGFPGETTNRDYFVNMGSNQGVKPGSYLRVMRKAPTYDMNNQKVFRDVTFPIARLKVIHVESNAAIARLHEYAPPDVTPGFSPRVVMVGDLVELSPGK